MANTFRVRKVYNTLEGATGSSTRYIPEFSTDGGTSWNGTHPGDQPQSLTQAQNRLAEIVANETSFNAAVAAGRLGTASTTVAYP